MSQNYFVRSHPLQRVAVGAVFSGIVYFLTRQMHLPVLLRVMLIWDVFSLIYCLLTWMLFWSHDATKIRQVARREDGSRTLVFILILLACFASMLMVLLLILSKEAKEVSWYLPVAVAGILLSWFMVHTIFTIHYAYLYYDDAEGNVETHAGGLEFPEPHARPGYLDFAYFAFVIGMTFQVSDVVVNRARLRRVVLLHGLLSFGLNTFVVALTINLIAGLRN
ncbi:DUF1345 domain-containing protein [Pseudoflavitalea sp. G-6-1-2]|uniref:DUF1345 domain-containing protein n=1 Tax=Pseudoflavitalea sp. G-6-1-2 TaxID=2728841 RepID=UPI001469EE52|nr:DUF1345 domain-containing protein [Pseudoflavitalea sp. G-6-1-2]NML22374.1 DUF1345 domain-containing protein [Pseudoflavitalea sp. G-6-1-2]